MVHGIPKKRKNMKILCLTKLKISPYALFFLLENLLPSFWKGILGEVNMVLILLASSSSAALLKYTACTHSEQAFLHGEEKKKKM